MGSGWPTHGVACFLVLCGCNLQWGLALPRDSTADTADAPGDGEADTGPPCLSDGDCWDGIFCNGDERCESGFCVTGVPVDCEDGDPCTTDRCNETMMRCQYGPRDEDGDDFVDEVCDGTDCDDTRDDIHPGLSDQACDGVDNDCSGSADDGYVSFECGAGPCLSTSTCIDGVESCTPLDPPSSVDSICDGVDEDCDTVADDDYTPYLCGDGVCRRSSTCTAGVASCVPGAPLSTVDLTCDEVDDDCDRYVDDDYAPYQCGLGACMRDSTCTSGTESCMPGSTTGDDSDCDGVDDDCDGVADEHWVVYTCGSGACERDATCTSGTESCTPGSPSDDTDCDGVDDDCDTVPDDEYVPATCGLGVCERDATCTSGTESCTPGSATGADTDCNGVDDDCDGLTDDGYTPTYTCGTGLCEADSVCTSSGVESCTPLPGSPDTDCDDVDDDCDTVPDDEYVPTTCGLGVCERDSICTSGTVTCTPGSSTGADDDCDGADEDCDGTADEHWVTYTCGVSVCEATATCISGVESCIPGTPTQDTDCDGVDDDCDTVPDDEYIPTTCGLGVCVRDATCTSGTETCTPGSATGADDDCNDVDEDCDGMADDHYTPTSTCGIGPCVNNSECNAGVESCTPLPGSPDTDCDDVDDDCDTVPDDDYVPTTCGLGVCERDATCTSGTETCTPGSSTGADDDCNDTDEDCDGGVDEHWVVTTCGTGACERDATCNAGVVICVPGSPLPDTGCDGVDDDCDTVPDDEYVPYTCGMGACERDSTCTGGTASCTPGSPSAEVCVDGIDQDCDGLVDAPVTRLADVRITSDVASSIHPDLAWTGSEFGLVWHDLRDGNMEIYFARVSVSGTKIGSDVRMTSDSSVSANASLVWTGSEFGVAWEDTRDGNYEIYHVRISDAGSKIGSEARLTSASSTSESASLVWTGSEFGVAWDDARDGNTEIYFARIAASGAKVGSDQRITSDGSSSTSPSLVWTGSEFGVAWEDARDGNTEIYHARISDAGVKVGSDGRITFDSAMSQNASLAWTGSEYGVCWQDLRTSGWEIYCVRIDGSGVKIGSDLRITSHIATSGSPSLVWIGSEFNVSWYDTQDGNEEIYQVRMSGTGVVIGENARLTNDTGRSFYPRLQWTSSEFGVCWEDDRDGNWEIYFNIVELCD